MKANNTIDIYDLARWIDWQLTVIMEGVSAGYTLGDNNSVWIDKGATVFTVSLATGEEIEIDSDNYANAEDIAKAIISVVNKNTTPETSNTMNTTTTTMNEAKATAIYNRVDAMKTRGAWNTGVKHYALMLLDWYISEASENPLTLETMLNGANDWQHYSRSGCGVAQCYNANIAETLCSPSELKRVKGGLKSPNSVEDWCDVEDRALHQAWQLIKEAETLVNCNA